MKQHLLAVTALTSFLGFSLGASAATQTATLDVSVDVGGACSVSTTGIAFSYDSNVNTTANGDVTVTCTTGTPYNIALDAGLHYSGGYRHVSDGTNTLQYVLGKDVSIGFEWGDSDYDNTYAFGSSLPDTGTGVAQPHTVYGLLYETPSAPTGTYTDVVTVTVYY